jgi:hypothetical protein
VAREDANQEAIAVIRARVDAWKAALAASDKNGDDIDDADDSDDESSASTDSAGGSDVDHPDNGDVVLRSPARAMTTSLRIQQDLAGHRLAFKDFDFKLKLFFKKWLPDEYNQLGTGPIKVRIALAYA